MLVLKALHISMVVAWFAGLFYLPRIFVNLAMVEPGSVAERDRLLWLWLGYGFSGGWLHAKTTLVALLVAYHWHCGQLLKTFINGSNTRRHVWFRFYNEMPVIVMFVVIFLVVLKPF